MTPRARELAEELKGKLGGLVEIEGEGLMGELYASVRPEHVREVVRTLKENLGFRLVTITCTDYGDHMELIYHMDRDGALVNLRARLPRGEPRIQSIHDIAYIALLYEREVWEMFGVVFEGHPGLRRLFLPEDLPEGEHPLRRG